MISPGKKLFSRSRGKSSIPKFDGAPRESLIENTTNRPDFVSFCQKALTSFLPPKLTNFSLAELAIFLKRLDRTFHPEKFGSYDLRSLVQKCKFIGFARGRYHVVRDFNRHGSPICSDNTTWSYVEPLSPQGSRYMHSSYAPFGDSRPEKSKYRNNSYTALSLKLEKYAPKRRSPRRNHTWHSENSAPSENTLHSVDTSFARTFRTGFGSGYQPAPDLSNSRFFKDI